MTYVKFHDTLKPSLHILNQKIKSRDSTKKLSSILDYDDDSEIFWEDEEDGESINYATDTEESEEESTLCSWIEEGDSEFMERPRNLKFHLLFPDIPIKFEKKSYQYDFSD